MLTDVPLDAMVFNQEPFGPMAAIRGFDTLDEAITESQPPALRPGGLCVHHVAEDRARAVAAARGRHAVDQPAGAALPEMPFGGVKDSGYGTEGGPEALDAYLVTKSVSILMG